MNKYQNFWDWFTSRSEYIYSNIETDTDNIALEITEHVKEIDSELEFEIPFDLEGNLRELIISADGIIELFDTVIELVDSAPKIPNWKITPFRPRLNQRNQIIDLDGITMDYNDVFFEYEIGHDGININVYLNSYDGIDNRFIHLYFLLLDSLIGEYDSVKCIDVTEVYSLAENEKLLPFKELLKIVDNYKNTLQKK